ncbi:MAG TPA: hypothetical protein VHU80_21975 [Polyangiaceae bacterium]|jgi:hypothetical protein|nr:hypothetical protein [Polyangiaceae bacterium]
MSEQKKPKIDLKARLGKKTVGAAAVPGGSVPPPVGIPKPPAMGGPSPSRPAQRPSGAPYAAGASSAPYAAQSPYASSPPGYGGVGVAPVRQAQPQALRIEIGEEEIREGQRKQRGRFFMLTLIVSGIVGALGFAFGSRVEAGKGANAALEGARELIKDIETADKSADQLNEVLAKASTRLAGNEYPAEEITALGAINIPFDGGHLTDKGIGRFKREIVTQLLTYANTAQRANDQKEKIQNLLSGSKTALTDILAQKTDPKVRWAVWVESGPGGPWANMQIVPTPFGAKGDWPADLKVPRGDANAVIKRYQKGDISSGDPQFLPVAPQTESMVCPSTTIVRLRSELTEMQEVLKGDATPGAEKTGFLQMGDDVVKALKKLTNS